MSLIAVLLSSSFAFACPTGAPSGYRTTPDTTERAYIDNEKTIQLVLKCDEKLKPADAAAALKFLGPVQTSGGVSYVDLKDGTLRIYIAKDAQLSVVAKTPEALAKASPALIEYLKK